MGLYEKAQMEHKSFTPPANPIGNAIVDWARGLRQRTMNPLATLAAEADRWRNMPVDEMASNLVGVGHTAWHGSPHLFDKFSLEKIGTGEGAQAYGHGMYLAESQKVAKQYQEQLTSGNGYYYRAEGAPEYSNQVLNSALDSYQVPFKENGLSPQDALKEVISKVKAERDWSANYYKKHPDYPVEFVDKTKYRTDKYLDALNKIDPAKLTENTGALYKTDIPDAHIDKMLDWDKPLSEQHPDVHSALLKINDPFINEVLTTNPVKSADGEYWSYMGNTYDTRLQALEDFTAQNLIHGMSGGFKAFLNPEQVRKTLQQAGIPGIKYLDGSSRTAGEGTRNFVIFNPDDIRILERNGQPTGAKPWAVDDKQNIKDQYDALIADTKSKLGYN